MCPKFAINDWVFVTDIGASDAKFYGEPLREGQAVQIVRFWDLDVFDDVPYPYLVEAEGYQYWMSEEDLSATPQGNPFAPADPDFETRLGNIRMGLESVDSALASLVRDLMERNAELESAMKKIEEALR